MKKFTSIILLVVGFSVFALAQSHVQSIKGTVIDKDSKVPLPGANIIVLGTDPILYGVTDLDGNFTIDSVPVGRQSVKITFLGYEETTIGNILLGSAKEVVLNVEMAEAFNKLEQVEVSARKGKEQPINDLSVVSTTTLSTEQTSRFAGSFEDPSRALLSFAGVSSGGDDVNTQIVIRGNSPRGLLWQVEGIEVPSPNHFNTEGASSGAVCAISSFMLSTSDFSTGAFAAEYGNALSGVFDVKFRKGNNETREYTIETSLLGLSLGMEGPFKKGKKSSYLINYRYSTLGLMDKLGVHLVGNANPGFQDVAFKFNFPTKKAGTFSVFGLGGLSTVSRVEDLTIFDTIKYTSNDYQGSDVFIVGVTNNYIFNERTWLSTVGSFSGSRTHVDKSFELTGYPEYVTDKIQLWNYSGKASATINTKFNSRHDLKSGLIFSYLSYDYFAAELDDKTFELKTRIDEMGSTTALQGFTNWRWRINPALTLNTGLHSMLFMLNNNFTIEPRASLKWQLDERHSLSLGVGLHSRREALVAYLANRKLPNGKVIKPNEKLDFTKAAHIVLGYDRMITSSFHIKAEIYYQHLYHVPIRKSVNSDYSALNESTVITDRVLINGGKGRNYGLELTMEKFFSQGYFFLINGSLYNSLYTPADGIERNTRYNGNFIVNALAGKEYSVGKKKNNIIGFGGKATLAGGERYTPIDVAASLGKSTLVYNKEDKNGEKGEPYYRFDVYLSYKLNRKRCSVTWRLDVQNVTNHHNINQIGYRADGSRYEQRQGQLLPVVGCKIEF